MHSPSPPTPSPATPAPSTTPAPAPASTLPRNGVPPQTIVIKLGTSSIVHETTHQPLLSKLSAIVEVVVDLKRHGHRVVLVSSGAIGVGMRRMRMERRPGSLVGKQALAAIGQGRLIALWDNLFSQLEQPIAQILLTRGDISDRTRYLNAVNTLNELLSMGVVPIVNENDTVSVSEIKFGDNDTLSAITSSMIHADYLFLLTDVDGLYTANPRKEPGARMIEVVESVAGIRREVSTNTLGSSLGTGGMETKLIAAEIATAAGVTTVITTSQSPQNVFKIIDRVLPRPPHTLFLASPTPLRDLKAWTRNTLNPSGSVVVDGGAYEVLAKRESGGRLLAVGVLGVVGVFAAGQAVRVVVLAGGREEEEELSSRFEEGEGEEKQREKEISESDVIEVGRGLANYNSAQIMAVKGLNSALLPRVLGYADSEYVVENITIRSGVGV
uniref:Glutamate 5-kinase n=1 Tax=Psilocybe cubensis TaxID=181762 RepID=A0A8H8CMM3_PSICU